MSALTIETLLDAVGTASPTNLATVMALRDVVRQAAPEAREGVKYGGLHYVAARPICGIYAFASHVTLEFGFGAELDDPDRILLGDGKYRRHIRFTTPEAVDPAVIGRYVAQAVARA